MKKILISGFVSAITLLILSILALYLTILLFPSIALEYYDPAFQSNSERDFLYYIHPVILGFALAWFWERFKGVLKGGFTMRGIEFGIIYSLVATLPSMWIIFSAMNVSLTIVFTWFLYGFVQALVAGLICEKMNP
ncbi:MAG: hypothetical protein KBF32_06905 [Chitinophagales bacterium]|nr:hypothetical protein [Chitinophagales bacterium]